MVRAASEGVNASQLESPSSMSRAESTDHIEYFAPAAPRHGGVLQHGNIQRVTRKRRVEVRFHPPPHPFENDQVRVTGGAIQFVRYVAKIAQRLAGPRLDQLDR